MVAHAGVVVADNMTSPPAWAKETAAYRAAIRARPDMKGVLLHICNGIDVSSRTRIAGS
jgi:predicted O-methyltransferase YrrM